MTLSGSESPPGHCPGPPVVGAALHWLHSLRLPLLFTIIFHHSDWAGYNPARYMYILFINFSFKNLNLVQTGIPLNVISKAPVERSCPSMALLMKNSIMHA